MGKVMSSAYIALLCLVGCSEQGFYDSVEKALPKGVPSDMPLLTYEDRFNQESPQPIDIIFSIDQSGSMNDNIAQVVTSIPSFLTAMDAYRLNYRIGVISTDGFDDRAGELTWSAGINYITPSTPNPEAHFSLMSTFAAGYGETGIAAVAASLTKAYDSNRDFYRVGAPLAYIVISDEADQSQYFAANNRSGISPNLLAAFLGWLEPYKEADITFSAIAGTSDRDCPTLFSGDNRYKLTTELTGGTFYNICDGNWEHILIDFAEYSVPDHYEYFLTQVPVVDSIQVYVKRGPVTLVFERSVDWEYIDARNSIVFTEYDHQDGDTVLVDYELEGYYD